MQEFCRTRLCDIVIWYSSFKTLGSLRTTAAAATAVGLPLTGFRIQSYCTLGLAAKVETVQIAAADFLYTV